MLGGLMYVFELFTSVHMCTLINLVYISKIYAHIRFSRSFDVIVCFIARYLMVHGRFTSTIWATYIFLRIIRCVDSNNLTWCFNNQPLVPQLLHCSNFNASLLLHNRFNLPSSMLPSQFYMLHYLFITINLYSAHMVTFAFSLQPKYKLQRYLSYFFTSRRWFSTTCINCLQAGHWCWGYQQARVVPHRGHHHCSRLASDLPVVPPWKHLSTRRCAC